MNLVKSDSPIEYMNDKQFKFFVSKDYEKMENERLRMKIESGNSKISQHDETHYGYSNPVCPKCGRRHLYIEGYNQEGFFFNDKGEKIPIYVQRYKCKKCGKAFQTKLTDSDKGNKPKKIERKNSFIPDFIKEAAHKLASLQRIPLRTMTEIIEFFTTVKISHESVRRFLKEEIELSYFNKDLELSGHYGYDAQWVRVDSKYVPSELRLYENKHRNRCYIFRLALFDLVRNQPVAERIVLNESEKEIMRFINDYVPSKDRKAIVTDLKKDYGKIMRKLGFTHQKCTFHLRLNINKDLKKELEKLENKIKSQNKNKSKKEQDEIFKNERHKISEWMKWFWKLFKKENIDDALEYVEKIREALPDAPAIVNKILNKNFMPEYRSFLRFLEKPHLGKLQRTNNQVENYFGTTFPKADKSKYRTPEGIAAQIQHRITKWNENNKNLPPV